MALEPVLVMVSDEPDPELHEMERRFWGSLALTAPIFMIAMSEMIPGRPLEGIASLHFLCWVQLVLATPVVVWGGWPFFQRGWMSLVTRQLNMFTLVALGTGTAYVYSVVATLMPEAFPHSFRLTGGAVAVYFEASAVIVTLVLLGQVAPPELLSTSHRMALRTFGGKLQAPIGGRPRAVLRSQARSQRVPPDRVDGPSVPPSPSLTARR